MILQVLESHDSNSEYPEALGYASEQYIKFARQTRGLIKFAKIAYPDLVGGHSPESLDEPLLEKNKTACR